MFYVKFRTIKKFKTNKNLESGTQENDVIIFQLFVLSSLICIRCSATNMLGTNERALARARHLQSSYRTA